MYVDRHFVFFISGIMLSQDIYYLVIRSVVVYCSIFWYQVFYVFFFRFCRVLVDSWWIWIFVDCQMSCPPCFAWCCWFFRGERGMATLLSSSEEYYGVKLVSRVMGSGLNQVGVFG